MKRQKHIFLILLLITVLLSGCFRALDESTSPSEPSGFSENGITEDGRFRYCVIGNEVTILEALTDEEQIIVPAAIHALPVTVIAESAFYQKSCMEISLPETIHTIENAAFYRCANLQSIYLP